MLSINLIPPSYFEQQRVRRLLQLFGGLLALVVAGMLAAMFFFITQTNKANEELAQVEPVAQEVERLKSEASNLRNEVGPIQARIKFIEETMDYNVAIIPVLEELAKYTYKKITYGRVALSEDRGTLTIDGWAPSIVDAGRYLMNLYRAKHLFSSVAFSGVPGYRTGAAGQQGGGGDQVSSFLQGTQLGFSFTATCRLVKPLTAPAPPGGAGGGAAAGAAGGAPGAAPVPGAGPDAYIPPPPQQQ
ncbi:MAG: hypothetical protein WHZ52_06975 [Armatimonadota bacterium]|jgi:hypothetical protein